MKDKIEAERVERLFKQFKALLSAREKDIVSKYYGIGNSVRHTLQELGDMYKVTRERIRQIKVNALDKLGKGK